MELDWRLDELEVDLAEDEELEELELGHLDELLDRLVHRQ